MNEKKQITVCICYDGDEEKLNKTLGSFGDSYRKRVKTVVLGRNCRQEEFQDKAPEAIWCDTPQQAVTEVTTDFVTVAAAGEMWQGNALEQACTYLEMVREQTDAAVLEHVSRKMPAQENADAAGELVSLDARKAVLRMPASLRGMILRTEAIRWELPQLIAEDGWDTLALCRILERKRTVAFVKNSYFSADVIFPRLGGFRQEWLDGSWYMQRLERMEKLLKQESSLFLQAQILVELEIFLSANGGRQNKRVLSGERLDEFLAGCGRCLQQISSHLLTVDDKVHLQRRLSYGLWSALKDVKYAQTAHLKLSELDFLPCVTLELLEYENGRLHLDASVHRFLVRQEHIEIRLKQNGKKVPIRFTGRFGGAGFFGREIGVKAPFAADLSVELSGGKSELTFWAFDGVEEVQLPVITLDYQSKVTARLKNSYWCFDKYAVTLTGKDQTTEGMAKAGEAHPSGKGKKIPCPGEKYALAIRICRPGMLWRVRRELAFLKEIATAPYGSKKMFAMRTLYWLTKPVYGRKNIWLTFDKLYKGGDCGEYFYRYMHTRKREVTPYYVIRKDVPDGKRLAKEGLKPLYYQTWKQRLIYLHASMVFATHSSVHAFCGFSRWEVRFVQDRLRAVNTCIQHGLSVQDLTADSNRIINNNKRYYCASPCEIENLARPEYDYDPEVLRLTGLARYDGLVDREQKQILITPTWRAYIAMPAVMGSARPYNPEFKHTEYYRIFQELLENKKLKETAKRTGYRIIYLLHPILSAQKDDFLVEGNVEILPATEINYEEILTKSSLMVTDYSGVQFDFAYMRKPVVYFHPPSLPPHFTDGGFSYEEQGFGEICKTVDELVDELCVYLESGCELKEEYRKREDAFFAFDDHENCRRIFEDALAYQRTHKS